MTIRPASTAGLYGFQETNTISYYGQLDLFGEAIRMQRLSNLYESIDTLREKYGKHTVFLSTWIV